MKHALLLVPFLAISVYLFPVALQAQTITNGDFENWPGENPAGWNTSNDNNASYPDNVVMSSDAHGGSKAMKGNVAFAGFGGFGLDVAPNASTWVPMNSQSGSVHGFFKFTGVQGDRVTCVVVPATDSTSSGGALGGGTFLDSTTVSTYKEFYANILYSSPGGGTNPSVCQIVITIGPRTQGDSVHTGSTFYVDDLAYDSYGTNTVGWSLYDQTSVRSGGLVLPDNFDLEQNFPNPFNPTTAIYYDLTNSSHVTLVVRDMVGRIVETLVNEYETPGRYKSYFDATNLPSGMYTYTLSTEHFSKSHVMTLLK